MTAPILAAYRRALEVQGVMRVLANKPGPSQARSSSAPARSSTPSPSGAGRGAERFSVDFLRLRIHDQGEARKPGSAATLPALRRSCDCAASGGECAKCKAETLQRQATGETATSISSDAYQVVRSGGAPLPADARVDLERRFGHSFADVRVHTDPAASAAARDIGARAYTVGNHIAFRDGYFAPGSPEGRRLLAHELTHVLQQRAGLFRQHGMSQPGDPDEAHAERTAEAVLRGAPQGEAITAAPVAGAAATASASAAYVQRACGPEIGAPSGCTGLGGDVYLGEPFLFDASCDTFRAGEAARLQAFARALPAGSTVVIHGFASEEGDPAFNDRLSCQRARTARTLLIAAGVDAGRITAVYNHGAMAGARDDRRSVVIDTTLPLPPEPTATPAPAPSPPRAPTPTPTPAPSPSPAPSPAGPVERLVRAAQAGCVARLGGCANTRSGGLPSPADIADYNTRCRSETSYDGPDITPTDAECMVSPPPPTVPGALVFARSLATLYPGWLGVLPDCPCTDAAARASADWSGPGACQPPYHVGAATGYRSSHSYSSIPGTHHGQQCCYDAAGMLITDGAGAGTPDLVQAPAGAGDAITGTFSSDRPGLGAALSHYSADVRPFNELGWEVYNQYWIPNRGRGCPPNQKP